MFYQPHLLVLEPMLLWTHAHCSTHRWTLPSKSDRVWWSCACLSVIRHLSTCEQLPHWSCFVGLPQRQTLLDQFETLLQWRLHSPSPHEVTTIRLKRSYYFRGIDSSNVTILHQDYWCVNMINWNASNMAGCPGTAGMHSRNHCEKEPPPDEWG